VENGKITAELEGNKVSVEIIKIHSDYIFVSPYGTSQENKEVEG
jgi:hypothetical protein